MTDNTLSGGDNDVTSKDTPTEVEADKIKGTQAEQSAKIAHTTQAEHMDNSSQSTPYAQGSAQVELDHYGLVLKAEPAISVDIEPKQPAICVDERNELKESK